ncbi:NAD(P)/FAD-dependent oxidoreductase [Nocardia sp. NBC_01388]|uniref:NAD(P)/FAD-dependent oxidoreductase n=1 Tax=Nocardia sp. NBC_01388 TaxID=2903596 RepID=UPI00324BDD27
MTQRIVIVGAGVAGATAAKTLRSSGYSGEIVLLGAEGSQPYRRPMVSKELLAGTAVERRMLLEAADFWPAQDIDLRTGSAVRGIDAERARVYMTDDSEIDYDALLLATGARPRRLPGVGLGAHTLRGRGDIAPIRAAIDDGSLLIVGAGLIGCEVAATAAGLGAQVTVVHAGPTPLDRVAPETIGEFFRKLHADNAVQIHTDVVLTEIEDVADGVLATATDGRRWTAGAALIAIGAVPETALAGAAGVAVADGILVDENYRTSIPGIYAAGDAAARFDPELDEYVREEHWNSAQAQGAAAAKAMLGVTPDRAQVPWGWSTQYGLNLQFAGRIRPGDELEVRGVPGTPDIAVLGRRGGRMTGAVAIGRPADIRAARELIGARG